MISIKRTSGFFTKNFDISRDNVAIGDIHVAFWQSNFRISAENKTWNLKKSNFWGTRFTLFDEDEKQIMEANRLFKIKGGWEIDFNGKLFLWQSASLFSRQFELILKDRPEKTIGTAEKNSVFNYSYTLEFPDQISLWFQAALVVLWYIRDQQNNA